MIIVDSFFACFLCCFLIEKISSVNLNFNMNLKNTYNLSHSKHYHYSYEEYHQYNITFELHTMQAQQYLTNNYHSL
jgi:hypothetical protein